MIYNYIPALTQERASLPLNFPTRDQPPLILKASDTTTDQTKRHKTTAGYKYLQTKYFDCEKSSTGQESQACRRTTERELRVLAEGYSRIDRIL